MKITHKLRRITLVAFVLASLSTAARADDDPAGKSSSSTPDDPPHENKHGNDDLPSPDDPDPAGWIDRLRNATDAAAPLFLPYWNGSMGLPLQPCDISCASCSTCVTLVVISVMLVSIFFFIQNFVIQGKAVAKDFGWW